MGARKPEQLNGIADAFGWRLDDEAMARIERILAETIQIRSVPSSWRRPAATPDRTAGAATPWPLA